MSKRIGSTIQSRIKFSCYLLQLKVGKCAIGKEWHGQCEITYTTITFIIDKYVAWSQIFVENVWFGARKAKIAIVQVLEATYDGICHFMKVVRVDCLFGQE